MLHLVLTVWGAWKLCMKNITILVRKQEDVGFFVITIIIIVTTIFARELFAWGLSPSFSELVPEECLSLFFLSLSPPPLFSLLVCISKTDFKQGRSSATDCINKACKPLSTFFKQHPYYNGEVRTLHWKPYWNALLKTNLLFCIFFAPFHCKE